MSAAAYVRRGSPVADIGTDHAYLPIYLIEKGISPRAVAADVNEGPLDRARINIPRSMQKKIELRLTDGLRGIEDAGVSDVLICGMGGELIARIIADAPFLKNESIRLILQPMTKAPALREFLLSEGFSIIGETLSEDDRIYQTLCAEYTGVSEKYSPLELLLGKKNIEKGGEIFSAFVAQNAKMFEGILAGKRAGGADFSHEEAILKGLYELL